MEEWIGRLLLIELLVLEKQSSDKGSYFRIWVGNAEKNANALLTSIR